jgi:putative ABC transport system permease protein
MDIHLAAGVQFDPASEQRDAILVNQALLRRFGWETHEGKQIPGKSFSQAHRIIGVVKDFHYSSLQQEIKPLILTVYPESVLSGVTGLSTYVWPPNLYRLMVRLGPGDLPPLLKHLEEVWANIRPEKEFAFHFVDEVLQNQYAEQRRWSQIIDLGSIFAIVVAWLGLLGLVRLSIQRRLKEVGIRRILGASVSRVVVLLSGRFIALVIAGNLVALPVAWYFSRKWLNSFSYRIELGPGLFIGTFALILIVTAVSLGWQTATAAHRNPARVLKSE